MCSIRRCALRRHPFAVPVSPSRRSARRFRLADCGRARRAHDRLRAPRWSWNLFTGYCCGRRRSSIGRRKTVAQALATASTRARQCHESAVVRAQMLSCSAGLFERKERERSRALYAKNTSCCTRNRAPPMLRGRSLWSGIAMSDAPDRARSSPDRRGDDLFGDDRARRMAHPAGVESVRTIRTVSSSGHRRESCAVAMRRTSVARIG